MRARAEVIAPAGPPGSVPRPCRWPAREVLQAALLVLALLFAGLGPHALAAAPADLPALTGRVVDQAGVLSAAAQTAIESKLKALEAKSGIQLEVAMLQTLGGEEIEPYANRLFRAWGLGEKTRNNGVLLLVVPPERNIRIEVGYGLEGTLTDATSKLIIANAIIPRFKAGDIQGGIERGVDDIIAVLSTDAAEWKTRPDLQARAAPAAEESGDLPWWAILLLVLFVLLIFYWQRRSGRGGLAGLPPVIGGSTWGSGTDGGSSGGGSSGDGDGGFSGGGGSSGGGGASGKW